MSDYDNVLWWLMLLTAIIAAVIGVAATVLDRRQSEWPDRSQRFLLHIASYVFMTISIAVFILRGLLRPA